MGKRLFSLFFMLCLCSFVLSGCGSVSPVVKTSGGKYNVIGYGRSTQQSRNLALNAAVAQCKRTRQQVMVADEESRYKGLISAEVNKAVKIASSLAKAAGETEASKTLEGASSDDSYETEINFTCE